MATCFVVMGFNKKTDLATGRVLDLDATYELLIKPAVKACGLACVRADEIPHSGVIDVPMYDQLLDADLVVADVSTANPNALYELGVRHALKPRATIIIAESGFKYPFDLNHTLTLRYEHLGVDIGGREIPRFQKVLKDAIHAWHEQFKADPIVAMRKPDSPVYTFLNDLDPPCRRGTRGADGGGPGSPAGGGPVAGGAGSSGTGGAAAAGPSPAAPHSRAAGSADTLAMLTDKAELALAADRFVEAKELFREALNRSQRTTVATAVEGEPASQPPENPESAVPVGDPYLIQRLALATYKARMPDEISALHDALKLLAPLNLKETNDPETLGIAGAIEKRLFDKGQGLEHLIRAIRYYQRGYVLKDDYYNGINSAFLLDQRAGTNGSPSAAEKIADHVMAGRIRRHVLEICNDVIASLQEARRALADAPLDDAKRIAVLNQLYWVLATQAEAYFGLAELFRIQQAPQPAEDCIARYQKSKDEAYRLAPAGWMIESTETQLSKLGSLLKVNEHLFLKLV